MYKCNLLTVNPKISELRPEFWRLAPVPCKLMATLFATAFKKRTSEAEKGAWLT